MPSSDTNAHRWLRRAAELALALVLVGISWSHGFVYVEGGSMEPALYAGDLAVYARRGQPCRRGDLVLFEHDGGLVVHRVAGVQRDGSLRTRGDANEALDSLPVDEDAVRGKVVLVLPMGRIASRLADDSD